ncbi:MAG: VOC family protein [Lachnospiraceae bacterium]
MKVSHVIYKVQDLNKGVEEFRAKGFEVEYGKKKNPYNALIYFSEGPYIELLASTGMPSLVKTILGLFAKGKKLLNRLNYWDHHPGGYCGLALENYKDNLDAERAMLKKYEQDCSQINSRRNDTKGRQLRFKCAYPYELQIPFYMTYFNIDPKPKNFVHPNGVKRISHITYGVRKELFPIIHEMCDDEMLELFEGDGIRDVKFECAASEVIKKIR